MVKSKYSIIAELLVKLKGKRLPIFFISDVTGLSIADVDQVIGRFNEYGYTVQLEDELISVNQDSLNILQEKY